ncbi:uncharacterized protein LOC123682938 [Harmonia axyridis]|uniref:lysozyme n=1 Tax=Harmonia axyridis TaxID=115357 RepID=A0A0S1TNZ3_HARAX|nr:uncharacterized protein LOC123682938 [Harmonia axyridis]ALM25919.1 i-type lysozyme 4 [Harmonia axyridis]
MKSAIFFLLLCIFSVNCFKNLVGTELEKCLRCICYATTFCNHLPNCVKAHITKQYWEEAGSPTLDYEKPSAESYRKCMANTNCVLNTMDSYTTGRGAQRDTNCDGKFDCKDRLAIHFNGLTDNYTLENYQVIRFDNCAVEKKVPVDEGFSGCNIKAINAVFF